MKKNTVLLLGLSLLACVSSRAGELRNRWVYLTNSLLDENSVSTVSNVLHMAKEGGMNGAVLGCGLEFYRYWPKVRRERLARILEICKSFKIEAIPTMWSLGYGSMQNYSVNHLEGVPIEDVPYVVEGTNAVFDAALAETIEIDAKTGFQRKDGYFRLIKKVAVKPHRRYLLSFDVRTSGLTGKNPFRVVARNANARTYYESAKREVDLKPTQDWTSCSLEMESSESDSYYLYVGYMNGWQTGSFELRNMKLAVIGPGNVLKRPGAPRSLRNAVTGMVYEEGRDYAVPKIQYPVTRQGRPAVKLALPPGSRVKSGDRLVFDCHVPAIVDGGQVSMCLSEPELYEFLADSARHIEEVLHPKRWYVSMDEFRNGGTCAACRARRMTMGEIYADAVTKVFNIIQKVHPGAEMYIWSDMLDPGHNGVREYYNCLGSFEDAWKGIPKDIVIGCWYGAKCETSMAFFSGKGFRTFAAAYYDEKPDFPESRRWRDAVLKTQGAGGIMYTTWRSSYTDLPAFCRMINEKMP